MTRIRNNEHHIFIWTNGGTELLYLFPRHAIPVDPTEAYMGPAYSRSGMRRTVRRARSRTTRTC